MVLRLYDRGMTSHSNLDTIRSAPRWVGMVETSGGPMRIATRVPFAPRLSIRCAGSAVYWGDGSQSAVRRYSNGHVTGLTLEGLYAEPISERVREAFVDSVVAHELERPIGRLTGAERFRRIAEAAMQGRPYEVMPYYQDMRISSEGSIWVLHPLLEGDSAKVWYRFTVAGLPLNPVLVPASFHLRAISAEQLWGVARGPYGEPEIRSYIR